MQNINYEPCFAVVLAHVITKTVEIEHGTILVGLDAWMHIGINSPAAKQKSVQIDGKYVKIRF